MDPTLPHPPHRSDRPTPPTAPIPPLPPSEPTSSEPAWPDRSGRQPPKGRPPWPLLASIAAAALVLVALIVALLLMPGRSTPPSIATATATSAPSATPTARPTPTPTPTPSGPPATHVVGVQATVNTGTPVVVTCPAGELALSGGWASSAAAPVYLSSRQGNGWQVLANGSGALVHASVLCLQHDPSVSVTERTASVTVAAHAHGDTFALCTAGEWLAGGGFSLPPSGVEVFNLGANGNAWGGYAHNTTASPATVTFYAECLHAPGGQIFPSPTATATIPPGESNGTQAACASGVMLTGGGYNDDGNAIEYISSPKSNSAWGVSLQNQGALPTPLNVYAMCLVYL
jgi:hypothetical protein